MRRPSQSTSANDLRQRGAPQADAADQAAACARACGSRRSCRCHCSGRCPCTGTRSGGIGWAGVRRGAFASLGGRGACNTACGT